MPFSHLKPAELQALLLHAAAAAARGPSNERARLIRWLHAMLELLEEEAVPHAPDHVTRAQAAALRQIAETLGEAAQQASGLVGSIERAEFVAERGQATREGRAE